MKQNQTHSCHYIFGEISWFFYSSREDQESFEFIKEKMQSRLGACTNKFLNKVDQLTSVK